jgi:hypothetical protein
MVPRTVRSIWCQLDDLFVLALTRDLKGVERLFRLPLLPLVNLTAKKTPDPLNAAMTRGQDGIL